jgi:hypothetical protein
MPTMKDSLQIEIIKLLDKLVTRSSLPMWKQSFFIDNPENHLIDPQIRLGRNILGGPSHMLYIV